MGSCFRCGCTIDEVQHYDYVCPTEPVCWSCDENWDAEPARTRAKMKAKQRMLEAEPFDWVGSDVKGYEVRTGHIYHLRPGDMKAVDHWGFRIIEKITKEGDHRVRLHFCMTKGHDISKCYTISTNAGTFLKRLLPGDEETSTNY